MQKTSKVTNVSSNGSYDGRYGTMYKFIVTFDNGDSGSYASKKQEQDKFIIGQVTDYTIEQNGQYTNIKPVQTNTFSGKPKDDRKRQYMIMLQSSTDYAIKAESELMDIAMKYLAAKSDEVNPDSIQAVRDILYPAFIANIQSSQKDILNHILSETKKHFPNE